MHQMQADLSQEIAVIGAIVVIPTVIIMLLFIWLVQIRREDRRCKKRRRQQLTELLDRSRKEFDDGHD